MNEEQNEVQESEEPTKSSELDQVESHRSWPKILLVVGLVIVFCTGTALGWYLSQDQYLADNDSVITQDDDTDDDQDQNDQDEDTVVIDPNAIQIDWLEVDDQYPIDSSYALTNIFFPDGNTYGINEIGSGPMTYVLGEVVSGEYAGYEIHHFMAGIPAMGTYIINFYLLVPEDVNDQKTVILDKYASGYGMFSGFAGYDDSLEDLLWNNEWPQLIEEYTIDTTTVISELEYNHGTLVTDKSGNKLERDGLSLRADYPKQINISDYQLVTELLDGTELREFVDLSDSGSTSRTINAFFNVRQDGRMLWYDVQIPFYTESIQGSAGGPALITWSDGSANENQYIKYTHGGCGATDTVRVVDDQEIIDSLVIVGSYSVDGDSGSVYAPANYDTEYYRHSFDSWMLFVQDGTWEDYVADYPYIYWQDSYGRWIEFMSLAVVPPAECGKPVIYLYPEEPTEIGIQIELKTMSVSEPDYGDGWNVMAYPDGGLVNLSDAEKYPYLFWEGTGKFYASPEYYWVVPVDEVKSFLIDTLGELGFNTQEIADFNEFWLPLMQEARYYKIGFHGTGFMNQLAPLDFTVRPNSLLRVLMDFEPLAAPIAENPPRYIPSFERNGFVVTEWGGILR